MTTNKYILGLGGSSHDFSATLLEDSNILCAIEDERITRRKHGHTWWFEKPCKPSIDYCLAFAGIELDDVSVIATSDLSPRRLDDFLPSVQYFNHHLCHAASVYHLANVEKMDLVICDGMGSPTTITQTGQFRETITLFSADGQNLSCKGKTVGFMPNERDHFSKGITNSLGYFYNMITRIIGFGKNEEGKTMGLVGYGKPIYTDLIRESIILREHRDSAFEFNYLESDLPNTLMDILVKSNYSFQTKADIATSAQKVFEDAMLHFAILSMRSESEAFGIAGGCALNTVANSKLEQLARDKGKSFFIYPHIGDAGIAFGAAFLALNQDSKQKKQITVGGNKDTRHIHKLGKHYSSLQILEAFNEYYPKIDYELCDSPDEKIADLLSKNEIVGLFHGPSEFGPRALGGRSILSNPAEGETRNHINNNVKHREPFRPIAPMILEEFYGDYFEGSAEQYFMLSVSKVKPGMVSKVPSVVHIDGTARVQTIDEKLDPFIYQILTSFNSKTGIPVICNTSFNQAGEPIVETPSDAIRAFLKMPINFLFIENYMFFKEKE